MLRCLVKLRDVASCCVFIERLLYPCCLPAQPRRFQRPASRLSPGPHDEMITPKTQQSNTKIGKTPNHICAKTLWPKKF